MSLLRLLALPSTVALLALTGCKGPCRQLSEEMCRCTTSTNAKNACLERASNEDLHSPATPDQDAQCTALLATCDCDHVDTLEGKQACGLAR